MTLNPSVDFKVGKFGVTDNFRLWQKKVNDLLAQEKLKERAVRNIQLCLSNEVMYHIIDMTSPGKPSSYKHLVTIFTHRKRNITLEEIMVELMSLFQRK
ncbi:hypothetical protein CR513_39224, partial [Mucuna pruriens]